MEKWLCWGSMGVCGFLLVLFLARHHFGASLPQGQIALGLIFVPRSSFGLPALKESVFLTARTDHTHRRLGMDLGADDYLTKPTHPTELQAHVRALLARSAQKEPAEVVTVSHEHHGYVIGVLSTRGGLGVSSLASNLAAGIYTRGRSDVILVEMIPGQGTIGMDLGFQNQKGLTELLKGTVAEITREKVESSLTQHNSGIKLLLASENPRDVTLTSQVQNYEALVTRLSTLARFIVLDLGNGLPAFVQKILPMCSERIIVVEGIPATIQHTKLLIDDIVNLNIDRKSISVVLNNRMRSESQMQLSQVQEKLGHSIAATLSAIHFGIQWRMFWRIVPAYRTTA
jgi:pilus assembly protein CpaE